MENLHRLAQRVLRELHEPVPTGDDENPHYPWADIYQALNVAKDELAAELLLSGERYRTLLFPADTPATYDTPASGHRIATLPPNFVRAVTVQVLVGNEYVTIEQFRPTEAYDGWAFPRPACQLSAGTRYVIDGDGLYLSHAVAGVVAGGVRVYMEKDVPDLLVGRPAANAIAGNQLVLAQEDDEDLGQEAAVLDDVVYAGIYLQWIDRGGAPPTQGALINTRNRIIAYDGDEQTCTMENAWTDLPVETDVYAMQTPFPRALDQLLVHYAAGKLQADAGEDPGPHMDVFHGKLEKWMQILDSRSPGQNRMRPYEDDPD